MKMHERRGAEREYTCNVCGEVFRNIFPLQAHQREVHQVGRGKRTKTPTRRTKRQRTDEPEPTRSSTHVNEGASMSAVVNKGPQPFPQDSILPPSNLPSQLHRDHWRAIRTRQSRGNRVQDWYNYRLSSVNMGQLVNSIQHIFEDQTTVFKLNLSFGFVLFNNETQQTQYHHPSANNSRVFDSPFQICNREDLAQVCEAMQNIDIHEWARQQRPNSKWIVMDVTNVTFYVTKLRDYPIGCSVRLPKYILESRAIVSLDCNEHTGLPYEDKLCFFRCLALHRGCHPHNLERDTHYFYEQYSQDDDFDGVTLEELQELERLFKLNIFVYRLTELHDEDDDTTSIVAQLIQRSHRSYANSMYVNIYGSHFSYIKNLAMYSKSYCCSKCDKMWKTAKALNQHERTCEATIRHIFPGGAYKVPQSIFDLLADEGIEIPEDLNTSEMIQQFVEYLVEVSQESYGLLLDQFSDVFRQIDERVNEVGENEVMEVAAGEDNEQNTEEQMIEEMVGCLMGLNSEDVVHPLLKLQDKLSEYLQELPILGFHSGKYDINAAKNPFFSHLVKHEQVKFVIKRNNNHMCLKTQHLKFLDITNYLAPGFSYEQFLKAYECSQTKGYFPYEWVDSLNKLNHCSLPPRETFHSTLSGTDITEEQYEYCQGVWDEQNMTTFRDFLVWYNNLDVVPFLQAIDKMTRKARKEFLARKEH
ncbi:Zinc finger and SCAN domain-containing 22 [Paramuricea clavata]|uniref:Zinc finger and SCAN domain-containing 22 n=1 Tax=Paramuricea clavata TaxID=317549 RepID=A0A6S7KAL2_PARCT|nr:Zinc finger and SCAN domain-containing 22 [Paramuricea clavata]